ncbi:hypothetical protein AB835_08665 [Candidatus Endobugula sertula]|uniref:Sulfotransferase domain-containing protein n=1 Tax=Candidatus Endobugula sertula TaxID=62101 RepID=A0A1D2QPI5_9GAMM|nr:hypothetical protein AB835_08665 [Candidatus Endobugula sertula]
MLIGVFGTGRNGSSLISHLIDGLGDTYVHPVEEKFLTAFDSISRKGRITRFVEQNCIDYQLTNLDKELTFSHLSGYINASLRGIHRHSKEAVGAPAELPLLTTDDLFNTFHSCDAKGFVTEYLNKIAQKIRPDVSFQHHLFKSIETPYIEEYERIFDNIKFIHIIRHPKDVCSSQKRSLVENKNLPESYLGYDYLSCMLDKRWVPHAEFIESRKNNPNHIIVKYENLVKDPNQEIQRIAKAFNLTPPPRPNVQTIFNDLDKKTWGSNPSKKGVKFPVEVVSDLQKKCDYTEVLSPRELDLISYKTKKWLLALDYELFSEVTKKKVILQYVKLEKSEFKNWRTVSFFGRGLLGLIYRRMAIF